MTKQEDTIIGIFMWVVGGILIAIFLIAGLSIIQMNDRIKEQNEILKEMVIVMQNQVKEAQKQNAILDYNPMEENK